MNRIVIAAALCACSCTYMIPRSTVLGQTAAPLAPGAVELGLSAGLTYAHEGPQATDSTGSSSDYVMLPSFDGSLTVGLADWIEFNLHGGMTGVQPGAKINLMKGDFSLAVQPQLGLGYFHTGAGSTTTTSSSSSGDYVLVVPGMRILASHSSGLYGGLGYSFEYLWGNSGSSSADSSSSSGSYQEHQLMLGFGYEAVAGLLRLRPEISFVLVPARSASSSGNSASYSGLSFALGASLTVALRAGGS